ncbi:DUF1799 domain-containing protein [Polaromonas sp. P2-4]|nr:DUF1799 domain-containing protein [Polaromonas sp. P2-4]
MGSRERGTLKKLIGAARRWAGADTPPAPTRADPNVTEGLRRMGVSEEDIEAMLAQQQEWEAEAARQSGFSEDFEIYEDNWESWLFFVTVQTQWHYAARDMGARRVGLNYPGVESGARMAGKPRAKWPSLFADLQVMELAVLAADAEMADAAGD